MTRPLAGRSVRYSQSYQRRVPFGNRRTDRTTVASRHTRRVEKSVAVDGFRLAYERTGRGPAVVLLHGWPGDRTDYRDVVPLLSAAAEVVVPDLRGYGESDRHPADPAGQYSAAAQARSVVGLIEELGLHRPVVAGYDIGSRVAQTVARDRP